MLRLYEAQEKLEGFLYRHFSYEDLLALLDADKFKHKIHYFPNVSLGNIPLPSVGFYRDKNFVILISEKVTNPNTRWYLLGHELGHYFLHDEEHSLYILNSKKREIHRRKLNYSKVIEAEASIFSKLTFIPLEYVRDLVFKRQERQGGDIFSSDDKEIKQELVQFSLEKFKDPKPKKVSLEGKISNLLDSYKVLLAWQNILNINSGPMNIVIDSKNNNPFKCPPNLFR